MPEIIPLGWFHIAIFQHDEFGPGHALAVMTLLAILF